MPKNSLVFWESKDRNKRSSPRSNGQICYRRQNNLRPWEPREPGLTLKWNPLLFQRLRIRVHELARKPTVAYLAGE